VSLDYLWWPTGRLARTNRQFATNAVLSAGLSGCNMHTRAHDPYRERQPYEPMVREEDQPPIPRFIAQWRSVKIFKFNHESNRHLQLNW